MSYQVDEDAMVAAIDLIGRSGATESAFGHLDDDVPIEDARWWAHAQYRGARLSVEDHRGPVEALEALARRLLDGAICNHCKKEITLLGDPTYDRCRWSRNGQRWERSALCLAMYPQP